MQGEEKGMKKRMQRAMALLLSGVLLCTSAGCGTSAGSGDVAEGTEAGTASQDNATESAEDTVTALSLMEEVNTKEVLVSEDNYRTWYELFVYSFYDSDGDGIGDLKGATESEADKADRTTKCRYATGKERSRKEDDDPRTRHTQAHSTGVALAQEQHIERLNGDNGKQKTDNNGGEHNAQIIDRNGRQRAHSPHHKCL